MDKKAFSVLKEIIRLLPKGKIKIILSTFLFVVTLLTLSIGGIKNKETLIDKREDVTENKSNIQNATAVSSLKTIYSIPDDIDTNDIFFVKRIVDGDTLVLRPDKDLSTEFKVRLIGIDTPESVDPRKSVECFGKEASAYTKSLVEGKSVTLEIDKSQGETDRYGRLLAYVFVQRDDRGEEILPYNLNERLISEGYAHEYTYQKPYKHQVDFKLAQKDAEYAGRGLWASDACVK